MTSNFSISHRVFYPFRELSHISMELKIVVCRLFEFGRVYNLLFGKGLRRAVASEQWSLKAVGCLIQVVSDTGSPVLLKSSFLLIEQQL